MYLYFQIKFYISNNLSDSFLFIETTHIILNFLMSILWNFSKCFLFLKLVSLHFKSFISFLTHEVNRITSCFLSLDSSWVSILDNLLTSHLSLIVLQLIWKCPYSRGNDFRINWTKKVSSTFIPRSKVLLKCKSSQ